MLTGSCHCGSTGWTFDGMPEFGHRLQLHAVPPLRHALDLRLGGRADRDPRRHRSLRPRGRGAPRARDPLLPHLRRRRLLARPRPRTTTAGAGSPSTSAWPTPAPSLTCRSTISTASTLSRTCRATAAASRTCGSDLASVRPARSTSRRLLVYSGHVPGSLPVTATAACGGCQALPGRSRGGGRRGDAQPRPLPARHPLRRLHLDRRARARRRAGRPRRPRQPHAETRRRRRRALGRAARPDRGARPRRHRRRRARSRRAGQDRPGRARAAPARRRSRALR